MAAGKRYYWLKLKEDFFRNREIKKLRRIAGGDTYTLIYLKLMLLSLKNNGGLVFEGTESDLAEQLSLEIDEDRDNVQVTLNFMFANNLICETENSEKYNLPYAIGCIGSESESAARVRQFRSRQTLQCNENALQSNGEALQCNKSVTPEKEIEIELELRDRVRDRARDIFKERKVEREKVFLETSPLCSEVSCAASDEPAPAETPNVKIDYKQITDLYNSICKSLPRVNTLSEDRKKHIRARFANGATVDDFRRVFEKAEASGFLKGANNRGWSAKFDWLILDRNFAKVLDGNYDNSYDGGRNTPGAEANQQPDLAARAEYERTDAYFDEGGPRVAWGDTAECQELYKQHWRELCYDGCMERMIHDKRFVAEKLALWAAMPEGEREKYNAHKS